MEQNDDSSKKTEDVVSISLQYQNQLLLEENIRLQEEINKLNNKIKQLQSGVVMHVSDEELIATAQLERLKQKAVEQELTLEEIKKFDLLVKNKKLAENTSAPIQASYKQLPENIDDASLVLIASQSSEMVITDNGKKKE